MHAIVDRRYCITHPGTILELFGPGVLLGMLASGRKSLLQRVVESHAQHGIAFPGEVGRAYRLAALIEYRVARIYARLAQRFATDTRVSALFRELSEEELEHGRLMELCRYTVKAPSHLRFVPALRDPAVRAVLTQLRSISRRLDNLTLDEALDTAVALEQGEINSIFERLLRQGEQGAPQLFAEQLRQVEDHARSVPRRIAALRQKIGTSVTH